MNTNLISNFIFSGKQLPDELINDEKKRLRLEEFILERISARKYRKGERLLELGEVPDVIYFLSDGVVGGYKSSEDGSLKLAHGWINKSIVTDGWQFIASKPSMLSIRVIKSNTVLMGLSRIYIDQMFSIFPYTRIFIENIIEDNDRNSNRTILMGKNGHQKLGRMRDRWPGIELVAPRSFIADLLHITSQHYCRLLREEQDSERQR